MRISDWSSDVCSSDLHNTAAPPLAARNEVVLLLEIAAVSGPGDPGRGPQALVVLAQKNIGDASDRVGAIKCGGAVCDDLDSIQRRERNRRNIDALYGTVIRNAVPVDERKRRVGPQSTQAIGRAHV